MSKNDLIITEYSSVAKSIHWLVAGFILVEYLIGSTLDMSGLKQLHIQIGFIIFLLVLFRIVWRITHKYPAQSPQLTKLNQKIATAGHHLMYLIMFILPLTGICLVVSKGNPFLIFGISVGPLMSPLPHEERHFIKQIHDLLANGLVFMALLHALAAISHQFLNNVPILSRMLPRCIAKFIENKHD